MLPKSKVWVFLTLLFISSPSFSAELSKASVKQLLSGLATAINQLDADAVASYLSDDVQITINVDVQGTQQVMKPAKHEYIAVLKQSWAVAERYEYRQSNVNIELQNNKALVTANVNESVTIQGQTQSVSRRKYR